MAYNNTISLILGVANVGDTSVDKVARFDTPAEVNAFINIYHERGGRNLDTARNYSPHAPGSSEPRLGAAGAGGRFTIDTKVASAWEDGLGGEPGRSHTAAQVGASIAGSLADLRLPGAGAGGGTVDVMYLHVPDRLTPLEETCRAMDEAFRGGRFRRFGLSNYTAAEVERAVAICRERGFNLPSVYQGQYNPIVRGGEKELFPLLRKHGIAFYAYSPAAGGFFKDNTTRTAAAGSRWDTSLPLGQIYAKWYKKPSVEAAADHARSVASQHGISGHAAALRWTVYHGVLKAGLGDAAIIGASSLEQLTDGLDIIEAGPLPTDVAEAFGAVSAQLGDDAIDYHL